MNFLEREAANRSLGRAGEELVLRFEQERLTRLGQPRLALQVEHVAATQGDRLGFDVLSFEGSGRERLIEVKTTRYGPYTAFFASRNEVAKSVERAPEYHVYRLYAFERQPRLFVLSGSLQKTCRLEPNEYLARVR